MWGDILADKPELIGALPDGVTVCEWGYEDWHPFDARTRELADAGRPFWVCPGTSSWLTILGRTTNMIGNSVALPGFPASYAVAGTSTLTGYRGINAAFTAGGAVSNIQGNTIAGHALYTSNTGTTFCAIAAS